MIFHRTTAASAGFLVLASFVGLAATGAQARKPLSESDIDDITTLVRLEDTRTFDNFRLAEILKSDHPEVRRRAVVTIGRVVNDRGKAMLEPLRDDEDADVRASVAFATGQLQDQTAVSWLGATLTDPDTPAGVAREAAQALGKIRTPEARSALVRYLANVEPTRAAPAVVGEALLSLGRLAGRDDLAPVLRWVTSPSVEIRWRAAWALWRPRNPAAVLSLLSLAEDQSAEVRYWAVRGLTPAQVDLAGLDRGPVSARLQQLVKDPDRRVRTEALRALVQYDDDAAFDALIEALGSADTWLSVSAAEAASRFEARKDELVPALKAAAAEGKPLWLRNVAMTPLIALAPEAAVEVATSLAESDLTVARAAAVRALNGLGELYGDEGRGGGQAAGRSGRGQSPPTPPQRTEIEYRGIVLRWVVPDYNGRPRPRVVWDTPRGSIELELYPGDAPLGVEYLMQAIESGDIVGTEFGRVLPDFVAQQQTIQNAPRLRDEVNRHGLTRGNLSWASSGLDTGRPGYTLGFTPQPHNEGNFTALGRVVAGLDVMDRLEWGDKVTGAKIK